MRAIRTIISMMSLVGLMGFTACTSELEETVAGAAAGEYGMPICFNSCSIGNEGASTRATDGTYGFISAENGHLKLVGFSVFAHDHKDDEDPISPPPFDFMWNQKVEYTFLADAFEDDPDDPYDLYKHDGYWSYSPVKYWPYRYDGSKTVPKTLTFCAYAPSADVPEIAHDAKPADGIETGIIGIAPNTETTPYLWYRRCPSPKNMTDLMWCYQEANKDEETKNGVRLKMRHALARVGVNVTLTSKAANIVKVLIDKVELKSDEMANMGKLDITSHTIETLDGEPTYIPTWTVDDADLVSTSITIDSNINNLESYGVIENSVAYARDAYGQALPVEYQPAGLTVDNPVHVLTRDDNQPIYLLLIPQEELKLKAVTTLHVFYNDETDETIKRKTASAINVGEDPGGIGKPLYGNRTYMVNLQLNL